MDSSPLNKSDLKLIYAAIEVIRTAIVSDIGSAKNIAFTLFPGNKRGIIYINGINNTTFLSKAKNMDIFAYPREIKVC